MAQLPATRSPQGGQMAQRREHPLAQLARDFDSLFGMLGGLAPDLGAMRVWDFDVTENDKEVVVRAELPGFEEKEIDVQINRDTLTIRAEKEQKGDRQEEYRSFFRAVTLPPGVDPENARATYRNGVLELHIPREAGARSKRIAIEGEQSGTTDQGRRPASNQNGAGSQPAGDQGQQAEKQAGAGPAKAKK
ncbi:MAG: heat shock protein Hsp20 [Gemmataceae bacterium]|nr:heat shock protein Hsp20 [Gemmataceae bacterium]